MILSRSIISAAFVGSLAAVPLLVTGQAEDQTANILLFQPLSIEQALDVASDNELQPMLFEHEFIIPGREKQFTGFISVSEEANAEEMTTKAKDAHHAFLLDVAAVESGAEATAFRNAAEMPSDIAVVRMTVRSKAKGLETLKDTDARVKDVQIRKPEGMKKRLQSFLRGTVETAIAAVNQEIWVPEYGKVWTGNSNVAGERYVQQKLHWDSVSGFGVYDTYEPEFSLYNYDGTNGTSYLNKSELWNELPVTTYAASDLPSTAYLDTRSGDAYNSRGERNELSYTIGTSRADDIVIGFTYLVYLRTKKGQAVKDKGKLQSQRGYRSPSNCHSTWCSFGYDSDLMARYKPVPSWSVPVPGYLEWRK